MTDGDECRKRVGGKRNTNRGNLKRGSTSLPSRLTAFNIIIIFPSHSWFAFFYNENVSPTLIKLQPASLILLGNKKRETKQQNSEKPFDLLLISSYISLSKAFRHSKQKYDEGNVVSNFIVLRINSTHLSFSCTKSAILIEKRQISTFNGSREINAALDHTVSLIYSFKSIESSL